MKSSLFRHAAPLPTSLAMCDDTATSNAKSPRQRSAVMRAVLFWTGVLLVCSAPLVGVIPGPGGVFVFAAGAALMLKNSRWAKKKYARLKKRHPNKGAWADWSLRRQSHLRRTERDKSLAAAEADVAPER